jgi:hypothetical protein
VSAKRAALDAALLNYAKLRELIASMTATACDLFSHPDATDAQRLDVAKRLGAVIADARRMRAQLTKANAEHGDWRTTTKLESLK